MAQAVSLREQYMLNSNLIGAEILPQLMHARGLRKWTDDEKTELKEALKKFGNDYDQIEQ